MKFRGVMNDSGSMKEFNNVVTTLSKLAKECVLRLSSEKLYFIVSDEHCGTQSSSVWCEMDQKWFFSEYLMLGVDENYKDIYLGVGTGNLARCLTTLKQSAKSIKIKLTKKPCPCLTLDIELMSQNMMHTRQVIHDVPVTVIPRKVWLDYSEPPTCNYNMPSLKQMKSTIDRMRNMSTDLIIKVNTAGHLILQIKTDLATVSSRFQNLKVLSNNDIMENNNDEEDNNDFITCRIDIKVFANYLTANQTHCTKFVCSILHNRMINLYLEKEGVLTLQCYISSIYR